MQVAVRAGREAKDRHVWLLGHFARQRRRNDNEKKTLQNSGQATDQDQTMAYSRHDAKAYAREHFSGIWAAGLSPFRHDLTLDESGLRRNLRHWVEDLGIDGVFIGGKQGEFFSMSLEERKRLFEIAVEEVGGARTCKQCGAVHPGKTPPEGWVKL
jgi:hypothetical protein